MERCYVFVSKGCVKSLGTVGGMEYHLATCHASKEEEEEPAVGVVTGVEFVQLKAQLQESGQVVCSVKVRMMVEVRMMVWVWCCW